MVAMSVTVTSYIPATSGTNIGKLERPNMRLALEPEGPVSVQSYAACSLPWSCTGTPIGTLRMPAAGFHGRAVWTSASP